MSATSHHAPANGPVRSRGERKNVLAAFFRKPENKAPMIALALLSAICFVVFRDYLLLKKVYLFQDVGNDTVNLFYPYLYHTAGYMAKQGLPSWSFNFGLGQNH